MRVVIATVQVPFIRGGGEMLAEGLRDAVRAAGHDADIVTQPFRFGPLSEIRGSMEVWANTRLDAWDAGPADRVIHLKFPCWLADDGGRGALWLLHQHRTFYELWGGPYAGVSPADGEACALRDEVIRRDTEALSRIGRRFTIAQRVSERLQQFNGLSSTPLYHPPERAEDFHCAASEPYVFFPSRLETLKRQSLLIEAMARVRRPLVALIAGDGGQFDALACRIESLGLGHRVRLLGRITKEEKVAFYACCRAVFFGPHDEDYGYVTLEAMLSSKPVITCTDSGGPLEFVVAGETGEVVAPDPDAVAAALDRYATDERRAREHGAAGLAHYRRLGISWDGVVARLLA